MKTVKVIFADPIVPLKLECDRWTVENGVYQFLSSENQLIATFSVGVLGCYEVPPALAEQAAIAEKQVKAMQALCATGATPVSSSVPPVGSPWMFGESVVIPMPAWKWTGVTEYTAVTPLGRYIITQDHSGTDFKIEFCERAGYTYHFKVMHKSRNAAYEFCRDDYRERVVRLLHKDGFTAKGDAPQIVATAAK